MDIVERLRKKADTLEPYPSDHKDDFREAADEIERLRAALEEICDYDKAGGEYVITCKRIAREALKQLESDYD